MFEKLDAEEARYNFKMDNAAEQAKGNPFVTTDEMDIKE